MTSPLSGLRPPARAALPLKDALRGLRFTLRQGRRLLAPVGARLPEPLDEVLTRVDAFAGGVARASEKALHRFLDVADPSGGHGPALPDLLNQAHPDALFAQAAYHGLDFALERHGVTHLMVSETLAAETYREVAGQEQGATEAQAARLMQRLLDHNVIGLAPGTHLGLDDEDDALAAVAVFAFMLWLLVDRETEAEDEDALLAMCCDVADTLRDEIVAARADEAAIAALLARYAGTI